MLRTEQNAAAIANGLIGRAAWRVRLGWGSFITFEFGEKVRKLGHIHGAYHLWIYMCDWKIISRGRVVVDSEKPRKILEVAVRRLECQPLRRLITNRDRTTTFDFAGDLQLVCVPFLDAAADEETWMLFEPGGMVLSETPAGPSLQRADESQPKFSVGS